MMVLPSADSATAGAPFPTAPVAANVTSCVHLPPLRMKTEAAPTPSPPADPPTMAMLPSAESATEIPWRAVPAALLASLPPCCVQTPSLRVNTHAAPAGPSPNGTDRSQGLSPGPPRIAVLPSADNATDMPWLALPTAPVPTSFLPCCVQRLPLRVNTHAAPILSWSDQPPMMAVLPSADSATDMPWRAAPPAPVPMSLLPCWLQTVLLRVNTHAPSARHVPTMAVLPSADSATEIPWPKGNGGCNGGCDGGSPARWAPVPTSLPCCVQTLPLRVNTHAAPVVLLSLGPPTMAVSPSADRATDTPCDHSPPPVSLVVPVSLPCCDQAPPLRVKTHAAPAGPTAGDRSRSALLGPGPPMIAVLPSADSATDAPWLALPTAPVATSFP